MSCRAVPPPASLGWDVEAVGTDALAVLRLGTGDADVDRVRAKAIAACELIDDEIDAADTFAVDPDLEAALHAAAVQVTVELYGRKDARFGVVESWSADTVPFRISGDPLAGVRKMIAHRKQRWGIG